MLVPGRGRREVLEALTYDAGLMIDRYGAGSAVCLFFFFFVRLFSCHLLIYPIPYTLPTKKFLTTFLHE